MTSRRRRWLFAAAGAALLLVIAVTAAARIPFSSDVLRDRLVDTLSDRLDADVALGDLTLRALPSLHAEGTNLTIRYRGRTDIPPLISVTAFTADSNVMNVWRKHVSHVKLDGLVIQIPPDFDAGGAESPASQTARTVGTAGSRGEHLIQGQQVTIDELIADRADVFILPKDPGKPAKAWYLHTLRMKNVSANTRMPFQTTLTNAVPPGEIATEGSFGPWHRDDPGHTPIVGRFTFRKADLNVFEGISGTLSATGAYAGPLNTITVDGETDTPDFSLDISRHPVPLHAKYRAVVDGTNGDTRLERVDASFLNTSLTATGGVFDVKAPAAMLDRGSRNPRASISDRSRRGWGPGSPTRPRTVAGRNRPCGRVGGPGPSATGHNVDGREVVLDVTMNKARLEDLMWLAVKSTRAPMTGALRLSTKFILPPGDTDVVRRMRLDGRFSIGGGGFTNPEVQTKINDMSRRASGKLAAAPPQSAAPRVGSDFQGRFVLANGVLRLPSLAFDIPGAAMKLSGSYSLERETIAFGGSLYMDAKVSQTVTGWKSMLLKIADPLFRRNGQTVVPITITGTRDAPQFDIDRGRVFKRGS